MRRESSGQWGRVVSQLHKKKEGRAAVLYIPPSLQAAELGSVGHASPPAWIFPISGSGWCSRTKEEGAHKKGGAEERVGSTEVDKRKGRES